MVPSIVIGAHPKRQEQEPIEVGLMFSRLTNAPLDVVGTYWFDSTPQRNAGDEYAGGLREVVERAIGDPGRVGGELRVHVASGSAAHALEERARESGAGLIVVGSTHRGGFGRIALGTTADKVVAHAPCPVAIAPRGFSNPEGTLKRVGVAFVDTPGGRSALRSAAAIARSAGATLIAYTVIDPQTPEADRENARAAVERALAEHADGMRAESSVLDDAGVETLIAETRELDLLLRGQANPAAVRRPLARAVPAKLVEQAACPVVIVPPGTEEPLLEMFSARAGQTGALAG